MMFTHQDFRLATLLASAVGIFLIPPLIHIHERALPIGIFLGSILIFSTIVVTNTVIFLARRYEDRIPALFTFAKFFITGVFNTSFDISIVNLLSYTFAVYAGGGIVLISTVSFFIVLIFSYLINRSWSFAATHSISIREFFSFTIASLGSFVINTVILYVLTTVTGAPHGIADALWINIVKLMTTVISMTWNFIAFRYFVFIEPRPAEERVTTHH